MNYTDSVHHSNHHLDPYSIQDLYVQALLWHWTLQQKFLILICTPLWALSQYHTLWSWHLCSKPLGLMFLGNKNFKDQQKELSPMLRSFSMRARGFVNRYELQQLLTNDWARIIHIMKVIASCWCWYYF